MHVLRFINTVTTPSPPFLLYEHNNGFNNWFRIVHPPSLVWDLYINKFNKIYENISVKIKEIKKKAKQSSDFASKAVLWWISTYETIIAADF